jgi:hypothetical protein
MKNLRLFVLSAFVAVSTFFIYSCTKDKTDEIIKVDSQTVQNEARAQITTPIDKNRLLQLSKGEGTSINELQLTNTASTCFPSTGEGGNTNCTQSFGVTAIGSLPAQFNPVPVGTRPACNDFQLTFDVLECYDVNTGQWSFSFSNFNAEIGNCPALQTWFDNLSPAEQANQIDIWEYQLSFPTQQGYIQNTILGSNLPYKACPSPTFSSTWATELCSYRCRVPTIKDGVSKFVIRRTICGGTCCLRLIRGCINASGFYLTFGTPTFITAGPSCPDTPPVCPPNSILLDPKCGKVCGPK